MIIITNNNTAAEVTPAMRPKHKNSNTTFTFSIHYDQTLSSIGLVFSLKDKSLNLIPIKIFKYAV